MEKSVTTSSEWEKMRNERPGLAAEVLEDVATILRMKLDEANHREDGLRTELAKQKRKEKMHVCSKSSWCFSCKRWY